jgi:hypothetical protein
MKGLCCGVAEPLCAIPNAAAQWTDQLELQLQELKQGGDDHTHCVAGCVNQADGPIGPYDGWLRRVTIAPQIGAGQKFFSQPVLLVFPTFRRRHGDRRGYSYASSRYQHHEH